MTNKVAGLLHKAEGLLKGKTFEELVEIYEGFTAKEENFTIENMIIDTMEKVDVEKFIKWTEEF